MMDMLRDMIHKLEARVAVLEANLPQTPEPPSEPPSVFTGDTIQSDDPTNEDDNG